MFKETGMFNSKQEIMDKHDNHENHNHEELLNEEWQKSQNNELIKALRAGESLENKLFAWPGFKEKPLPNV